MEKINIEELGYTIVKGAKGTPDSKQWSGYDSMNTLAEKINEIIDKLEEISPTIK